MQQTPVPVMRATWSDLTVEHHGVGLFHGFTYAVPDGTYVGLVGPDSAALDVALRALVGRYAPTRGTVAITGAPASVSLVSSVRGAHEADPLQRVREAVAEVSRVPQGSNARAFTEWSLTAAGLGERGERLVGELTTSESVRLGLALAASAGASVIALDVSPIAGDPSAPQLMMLLRQLANGGRLLIVGAPAAHESMDVVLPVPAPTEVLA
jgi:ABC-type branched-subunit amino acid transport system ATPase component